MIYSMTGFGAAAVQGDNAAVSVEIKSVNNRFFKISLRMTDGYTALEPSVESTIRKVVDRGTINVSVRIRREKQPTDYKIAAPILQAYFEQLLDLGGNLGSAGENQHPRLDQLVLLPGVVETENDVPSEAREQIADLVQVALEEALQQLQAMRKAEGDSMARDLSENIRALKTSVSEVERLAPNVAPLYRQRLTERIDKIMSEQKLTLNEADLVREIALYTDRCDISEETVRFRSHLDQFELAMQSKDACGKKLDFLTQELFRETNTMGSKANDAGITNHVVEMKTVIERIREMVQNIE